MRCRAMPYPALRYCTVRCCVVLCRAASCAVLTLSYRCNFRSIYHTRCWYNRFVRTLLNHKQCTPSSAQLSNSAAQRSAVRCRAVPCPALQCGAVPCCAVLRCDLFRTYSSTNHQTPRYRCAVWSCFFFDWLSPLGPHAFVFANYTRTAHQTVTLPASTQHSTAQRDQLRTSSPWHYQNASCTKSPASSSCPLHFVVFFLAQA